MKIFYKILIILSINFYSTNYAFAEVKIENINPLIIDNVVPIQNTNINSPIVDSNQDKTVIDSKIDLSSTQIYQDSNSNKSSINNFALGISFGKKIEIKNWHFDSPKFANFFDDKFILTELFMNKNIIKNSSPNNLNVDSLYGFRCGFGKDFGDLHLIFNSALSSLHTTNLIGNTKRNFLILLGLSGGYEINKNIDIRLNILTSALKKNSNLNQIFNNFDLSVAFNF